MKKTWKKLLGVMLIVSLVGVFAGCKKTTDTPSGETSGENTSGDNSASSEPGTVTYTLSVDKETVELVVGGDAAVITVITNGTAEVEVESEAVATAVLADGKITVTPVAAGSTTVVVTLAEDDDKEIEIPVSVVKNTMVLTLNLDEAIAIPGGTITVKYGSGADTTSDPDDDIYITVNAVVASDGKSATVELDKSYANSWGWFNGIVFTIKDKDGNTVDFSAADNFQFNADDKTLEVKAPVASKTFPITFEGFEIPGGTVTGLVYTTTENDWTTEEKATAATVTVAADGKSASFTVLKNGVQAGGWFQVNFSDVVIKDADGTVITPNAGNGNDWFDYNETDSSMAATLKVDAEVYNALCTDKAVTYVDTYVQLVAASDFEGLSFTTLKVTISSGSWASLSAANKWESDATYLSGCVNKTTYITTSENSDFITAMLSNGLYMEAAAGDYTVTVEYK